MKIELSSQQAFCLADTFAQVIVHHVRERNLWMIGYERGTGTEFAEVQATIRTLSGWDRVQFLGWLRSRFQTIRQAQGLAIHGRDYAALVRKLALDTGGVFQGQGEWLKAA